MKRHFVVAALANAALLAGCGGGAPDTGAAGQTPRLLATSSATASVSVVNSTNSTFTSLSTLRIGQTAYFQVQGSQLPSTLALTVVNCTGMTTLSVTSTEAHYQCTPGGTSGMKAVTVKDKTNGTTLYSGTVNVQPFTAPTLTTPFPMPTRGFNLGNSMEAMWSYAYPSQAVFTNAANAGFNAVRMPCAWATNTDASGTIDPTYLANVKRTVDYAIGAGMYVVINIHWDGGWFDSNIGTSVDATLDAKYRNIWKQIATAFAGYDNHVVFAAANEPAIDSPTKMNTLMSYYQSFVNTVRAAGGNNTKRWLMLPIQGDASWISALPTDTVAGRLGVEFHNYTPSLFTITHTDQSYGNAVYFWGQSYHYSGDATRNATWGEEGYNDAFYQRLQDQFVNKGVPVMIGEYQAASAGLTNTTEATWNNASVLYWNKYLSESARAHGLSPFYWSTPNAPFVYDTGAITNQALVTALTGGDAPPPPNGAPYAVTGVTATAGTGQVTVSWTAVSGATSYQLYRTANSGSEAATPSVTGITGTTYTDTGLNPGTTYYYRVVAVNGSGASGFSTEAKATTSGTNPDPTKFHFETDTQSWTPSGSLITGVATSTAQHYAGQRSLAVNFAGTAAGYSSIVVNDAVVPPGATITFHVWIPAGSQITKVEPYLQDYNWTWTSNPSYSFTPGAWNTFTLTVPTTAITPAHNLGLSITTGAAWTGAIYVDSINW